MGGSVANNEPAAAGGLRTPLPERSSPGHASLRPCTASAFSRKAFASVGAAGHLRGARASPHSRPSTTDGMRRASRNAIEDAQRQKARNREEISGVERRGWDVGERPSRIMAFIEYPVASAEEAVPAAVRRDQHTLSFPRGSQRAERETRATRSAGVGWAAGVIRPYAPLGDLSSALDPDADTPAAYARRRKELGLRVVWPESDRLAMRQGDAEPKYEMTLLRPGVVVGPCRVDKNACAYYCVDKPASKVLRVSLEALGGDPDMYVCNECRTPSFELHTWKATSMGGDILYIHPTDPLATPGRYYIAIYGTMHNTAYNIHVTLENPAVRLPEETKDARSSSFKQVCDEIRAGQQRSSAVRAGASLLDQIDSEIASAGHEPAVVRAAAKPVMRQIDEIRMHEIRRSRSPSPERLACRGSPPRHEGEDASESGSISDAASCPGTSGSYTAVRRHSCRHLGFSSRPTTAARPNSASPSSTASCSRSSDLRGTESASRPSSTMRISSSSPALRPSARPGSALIDTIRELNFGRNQAVVHGAAALAHVVAGHARGATAATVAAPAAAQSRTIDAPTGAQILLIVTPPASPMVDNRRCPSTAELPQTAPRAAATASPLKGRAGKLVFPACSSGSPVAAGMHGSASAPMMLLAGRGWVESLGSGSFTSATAKEHGRQEERIQLSRGQAATESADVTREGKEREGWLCARPLPEKPAPPAPAAHEATLQFDWQAPAGVLWSTLPLDLRVRLARSQYAETKVKLDRRLTEQLDAAAARRPLEYQWRMQVMARIQPESTLFGSEGLRLAARAIEAEYAGAALAGTAGHPEAEEWGDGVDGGDERAGRGSCSARGLGASASVPELQTRQRHSQRVEQYLADKWSKRRDGGKGKMNAVTLLERNLKPPPLDSESDAPPASPKLRRRGSRNSIGGRADPKPKTKAAQRVSTVLRNLQLDESSAHKTLTEQLADALLATGDSIIDVFHSWDGNSSGSIDKVEFAQAIRKLGFEGPQHDIECAFDMFDGDGSGFLRYDELAKPLRLRPSAAGRA